MGTAIWFVSPHQRGTHAWFLSLNNCVLPRWTDGNQPSKTILCHRTSDHSLCHLRFVYIIRTHGMLLTTFVFYFLWHRSAKIPDTPFRCRTAWWATMIRWPRICYPRCTATCCHLVKTCASWIIMILYFIFRYQDGMNIIHANHTSPQPSNSLFSNHLFIKSSND